MCQLWALHIVTKRHFFTFIVIQTEFVIQTEQDASELQCSLDALVAWSDQWQLSISSKKISSAMPRANTH